MELNTSPKDSSEQLLPSGKVLEKSFSSCVTEAEQQKNKKRKADTTSLNTTTKDEKTLPEKDEATSNLDDAKPSSSSKKKKRIHNRRGVSAKRAPPSHRNDATISYKNASKTTKTTTGSPRTFASPVPASSNTKSPSSVVVRRAWSTKHKGLASFAGATTPQPGAFIMKASSSTATKGFFESPPAATETFGLLVTTKGGACVTDFPTAATCSTSDAETRGDKEQDDNGEMMRSKASNTPDCGRRTSSKRSAETALTRDGCWDQVSPGVHKVRVLGNGQLARIRAIEPTTAVQSSPLANIKGDFVKSDQQAKTLRNGPQTPQQRTQPPTAVTESPPASKKRKSLQSASKPKRRKVINPTREMPDEASDGSGEQDVPMQESSRPVSRTTARRRARKMSKSSFQQNGTSAVQEMGTAELPALSRRDSKELVPMSFGDSDAYMSALEGIDTDKLPNDDMWNHVMDMMSKGPMSGGTKFPDILKMTLTLEYVEMLIHRNGLDLSEPLWQKGEDIGLTILEQIKSVLYGNRTFRDATIHAKMCAARMLRHILEWALTDAVRGGRTSDATEIMKDLSFNSNPKIYVESAVDALASLHGDAVDDQGFILELRHDLATCISFFAWWYGVAAYEDADALADLISQRHPTDMGLINKLNSSLIPQVRPKLAERWGIADQYNIIYG